MNKLNKKYNSEQIIELVKGGKIEVRPNYALNTYGTSSSGLLVRKGITIKIIETQEEKDYQIVFSSRGYGGTITSDLVEYNGRMLVKHYIYEGKVEEWFDNFLSELQAK